MLRTALRELRYHPGRYLATLIAVAISIGFMAASSVVTSTEKTAMARQQLLPYGDADLVVSIDYPRDPLQDESEATADAVVAAITKVPGVSVAAPVHTSGAAVKGPSGSNTLTVAGMLPEQLRGSTLRYGRWPTAPHEIALGAASAEALGVNVGGELQSVFDGETWTLTGVTDDPKSLSGAVGYVADSYFAATDRLDDSAYGTYSVKLAHAANMAAAKAAITAAIAGVDSDLDVSVATLAEQFTQAASSMTGDVDALKYVLWVFATISIVVGMITIANTFTILLAGRRRQIGLLRAIGADGAQVRRSVLLEAAFIGLAGACLGVGISVVLAVAVGLYTGSIHWGVSLPWLELAVAIGIGMAMTVAAAFLPSMRNTSIAPMEALRPTDSVVVQRRIGAFRKLACSLLVVGGGVMAWFALKLGQLALPVALVAAALITLGVLFAAP
ncbi:MAG: ABC transporter permease, partial [Propionibacteriaceae bacterium]|nr:ABC transporter permease [Propionibacteriaceae bacterium]